MSLYVILESSTLQIDIPLKQGMTIDILLLSFLTTLLQVLPPLRGGIHCPSLTQPLVAIGINILAV